MRECTACVVGGVWIWRDEPHLRAQCGAGGHCPGPHRARDPGTVPQLYGVGEAFAGNRPTQSRETGGSSGEAGWSRAFVHPQHGKAAASLRAAERTLLAAVGGEKRREERRRGRETPEREEEGDQLVSALSRAF